MTTKFTAPGKQAYYELCRTAAESLTDVMLNSCYAIDATLTAAGMPPLDLDPTHVRHAAAAACRQERATRIQARIERSMEEADWRTR